METITVYPETEKQKSLLKTLLEELKMRFEVGTVNDTLLSEKEF